MTPRCAIAASIGEWSPQHSMKEISFDVSLNIYDTEAGVFLDLWWIRIVERSRGRNYHTVDVASGNVAIRRSGGLTTLKQ